MSSSVGYPVISLQVRTLSRQDHDVLQVAPRQQPTINITLTTTAGFLSHKQYNRSQMPATPVNQLTV